MPAAIEAGLWGLIAGIALVLGAALAYGLSIPKRVVAGAMAFGSGVLLSALSFDLMDDAFRRGGALAAAGGFALGVLIYSSANWVLARSGAKHRKRSGDMQPTESEVAGSGTAIALGSLIDGVPESLAIGVSMLDGKGVSMVAVFAIFLSNLPEGLASTSGMKAAGRSGRYIFTVWVAIALLCGASAVAGYTIFAGVSAAYIAIAVAVAAGAILAMLVDTMIPEAFSQTHEFAGLIAGAGFLLAFTLSKSAL